MFTVTGRLRRSGRRVSITWDDGRLSGDIEAVGDVEMMVQSGDVVDATVTGPFHEATIDPADGWWVQRTIIEVFDPRDRTVEGKAPGPPPDTSIPPGAVS